MIRRLAVLLAVACVLAIGLAAASTLEVDGGTSQVFDFHVDPTPSTESVVVTTSDEETPHHLLSPNMWRLVNGE